MNSKSSVGMECGVQRARSLSVRLELELVSELFSVFCEWDMMKATALG